MKFSNLRHLALAVVVMIMQLLGWALCRLGGSPLCAHDDLRIKVVVIAWWSYEEVLVEGEMGKETG
jgi:hypothetical protein